MAGRRRPFTTQQSSRPPKAPGKGFYRDIQQGNQPIDDEIGALEESVKKRSAKFHKRRKK